MRKARDSRSRSRSRSRKSTASFGQRTQCQRLWQEGNLEFSQAGRRCQGIPHPAIDHPGCGRLCRTAGTTLPASAQTRTHNTKHGRLWSWPVHHLEAKANHSDWRGTRISPQTGYATGDYSTTTPSTTISTHLKNRNRKLVFCACLKMRVSKRAEFSDRLANL
jgi:hypothetical protein